MQNAFKTFLAHEFIELLQQLKADAKGHWGKMNAQQMVEHFADAVNLASGKEYFPPVGNEETIKKSYAFLMSDKPFRENTRNPYMAEEPAPCQFPDMQAAIENLRAALDYFFQRYENTPGLRIPNPFFGDRKSVV